jgi:hypothetical protein
MALSLKEYHSVTATHLGGVEGGLQGDADGAPEVYATDDTQHDPLVPGKPARGPLDAHTGWLQEPRLPVSFIQPATAEARCLCGLGLIWTGAVTC